MELKTIQDAGGHNLTVLVHEGRLLPDFPRDAIAGMKTFSFRTDDVVVCAYPKSGTHWVWEMIRLLLAGTTDVVESEKDDGMVEFIPHGDLQKLPSPRSLNTHYHFELMPSDVFKKKCKLVYVTRDPRDVAVSYFNHHSKLVQYYNYTGQWKDYFHLFLNGQVDYESWFAYTKNWEQGMKQHPELPIFVTSYEELHEDTLGSLKKLANFLEVAVDEDFLNQVMKKCSFETMRATKGKHEVFVGSSSPIMYRKGKVGDWKNWFTVAQSEQFNAVFEQEMAGTRAYNLYSHKAQERNGVDRCV